MCFTKSNIHNYTYTLLIFTSQIFILTWIAELHATSVMRAEAPEQLHFMHLATAPLANARGIVEDQERRDTANILENVPQALADMLVLSQPF